MKNRGLSFILMCSFFLIMTGTGRADVCDDIQDAADQCVYNRDTLYYNVDFDDCVSYSTKYNCESNGCIWWSAKNKCLSSICHTDSNFSGIPNVSEFIMWKHEAGRKCPSSSCNDTYCKILSPDSCCCDDGTICDCAPAYFCYSFLFGITVDNCIY